MDFLSMLRGRWARTVSALLVAVGVVAIVLGYVGASGTAFTAEQIPYLASGAVGGLFLLGVAATLFLSADLYDEWKELDKVERHLADLATRPVQGRIDAEYVEQPITDPVPVVARRTSSPRRQAVPNGRTSPKPRSRPEPTNG